MTDSDKKSFTEVFKDALAAKFLPWNESALAAWWGHLQAYDYQDVRAGINHAAIQTGFLDIAHAIQHIRRAVENREIKKIEADQIERARLSAPASRPSKYDYEANQAGLEKLSKILDEMGVKRD